MHRDLDLIAAWAPDLVILDEAQRIKNWSTRTARSVKKIASPYAIVLTGTPLENRLEELVSIVQFVDQLPARADLPLPARPPDPRRGRQGRRLSRPGRIGKTLAPILIRRQKAEVLEPAARADREAPLRADDARSRCMHHEEQREIVARIVAKWRRYRFLSEADQRRLMIALQNMRMACDSTYLLDQRPTTASRPTRWPPCWTRCFERPDTKAVIFSQWLRMHELLMRAARSGGCGATCSFTAACQSAKRKDLVDRFRDDPRCRAFLSTDAGGVGLNLQHASVVVNVDLPWNPAVLEQRIGRVHRLGQTHPVQVVNFVAKGTIEEGMLSVLASSSRSSRECSTAARSEVFLGGSRLARFMQSVEGVTTGIPVPVAEESPDPAAGAPSPDETATDDEDDAAAAPAARPSADALDGLLRAGLDLLSRFAAAPGPSPGAEKARRPSSSESATTSPVRTI